MIHGSRRDKIKLNRYSRSKICKISAHYQTLTNPVQKHSLLLPRVRANICRPKTELLEKYFTLKHLVAMLGLLVCSLPRSIPQLNRQYKYAYAQQSQNWTDSTCNTRNINSLWPVWIHCRKTKSQLPVCENSSHSRVPCKVRPTRVGKVRTDHELLVRLSH